MCPKPPKEKEPAAAPAPPLEAAEVPKVGDTRREETMAAFGTDAPNYRAKRGSKKTTVTPSAPIQM